MSESDPPSTADDMTDRPQKRRGLAFVLMLLVAIASTLALGLYGERPEDPDYSDASDFLASAYHIANYGTFVLALTEEPYNPGMGREPGYSLFLAGLMKLDPTFREFSPVWRTPMGERRAGLGICRTCISNCKFNVREFASCLGCWCAHMA
jgi:hypothetical protein